MIDNAVPPETHLGSAIPSQRTDGQPTGSQRIGAHRIDGPRATDDLVGDAAGGRIPSDDRASGVDNARVTGSASRHVTGTGIARVGAPASGPAHDDEPDRVARPAGTSWFDDATMVLPAFLTGRIEAAAQAAAEAVTEAITARTPADAVAAAGHAQAAARAHAAAEAEAATGRPVPATASPAEPSDRLPSSERNMLIFVAMLLALGTIAVVATMGVGKFG